MSLGLETLTPCLQGIVPSMLFTCSKSGIPNAAYLSHVDYVDPTHVALSFQFFNKSRRNIAENPQALVHVIDPDTAQGWKLRLRYVRSETTGPVFQRMALRIEAIASYTGLKGIFRLLAADIYEVLSVEPLPGESAVTTGDERRAPADAVFTLKAMQDLSARVHATDSLESLLDSILLGLDEAFGFQHSMILMAGERPGTLVTIATHGYPEGGVGAEARFGEGIIGLVAEAQKPIRISGLLRGMLYAYAVQKQAAEAGLCPPERNIALPGMPNPASQLGVPLVVRGELVGVLCLESDKPYRFHEEDKTSIELLGSYLAIAIQNAQLREEQESETPTPRKGSSPKLKSAAAGAPTRGNGSERPDAATPSGVPAPSAVARAAGGARREVAFHRGEEVIMVDGEYLIRSLPARILWKLLSARASEGREEFTNRELRLDKSLNLPGHKDNLETRLLLLRRRLVEKCPDIRLVSRARGRFALDLDCEVTLTERA
jgi:hypothetical protein